MKVYTRIVVDMTSGKVLAVESYQYHGPIALADRALTAQAEQAGKTAQQTAGQYGAAAGGVQANLVPRLESWAGGAAPGFGPFGLSEMETAAEQTAGSASGSAQEQAKLRAMRTGNAAGVGATQAASAEGAARAGGSALQDILARNAALKAQQMSEANRGLEGVLGEDIRGQTAALGIVPEDVNAAANAQKVGWLQDTTQMLNALSGLGAGMPKG